MIIQIYDSSSQNISIK